MVLHTHPWIPVQTRMHIFLYGPVLTANSFEMQVLLSQITPHKTTWYCGTIQFGGQKCAAFVSCIWGAINWHVHTSCKGSAWNAPFQHVWWVYIWAGLTHCSEFSLSVFDFKRLATWTACGPQVDKHGPLHWCIEQCVRVQNKFPFEQCGGELLNSEFSAAVLHNQSVSNFSLFNKTLMMEPDWFLCRELHQI